MVSIERGLFREVNSVSIVGTVLSGLNREVLSGLNREMISLERSIVHVNRTSL